MESPYQQLANGHPELMEKLNNYNQEDKGMAAQVNPFSEDLADKFATSVSIDTSSMSAFKKKFAEAPEFTENVGNYLSTIKGDKDSSLGQAWNFLNRYMSARITFVDDDGNFKLGYETANERFGDDFDKLDSEGRRERLNEVKAKEIKDYFSGVMTENDPVASGAGTVVGYMTDISTLAPLGKTAGQAFTIGGSLAAADIGMEQLAIEGKADVSDMMLAFAFGGAVGYGVKRIGDEFMPYVKGKLEKGDPITPEDLLDTFDNLNVSEAKAISESFHKGPLEGEWIPGDFSKYQKHSSDNLAAAIGIEYKPDVELKGTEIKRLSEGKKLPHYKGFIDADAAVMEQRLAGQKGELSEEGAKRAIYLENTKIELNGGDLFTSLEKEMKLAQEASKMKDMKLPKKRDFLEPSRDELADNIMKQQSQQAELFRAFVRGSTDQSGFVEDWLMRDLAAASIGGAYGYTSSGGDAESAMMWAIASGSLAHAAGSIGPKLYNNVGKMKKISDDVTEEVAERWTKAYQSYDWIERPAEYFKSVAGSTGHKFSSLLTRMHEDIRSRLAEDLIDFDKEMVKLGIKKGTADYKYVTNILRDPKLAPKAPKHVQEAAWYVRQQLNNIVKEAIGRKVIKPSDGQKMIRDSLEKGYFPRVYDNYFLASKEGKAKWKEVLSKHHWSAEEIKDASKSILNEKDVDFSRFTMKYDAAGNPKYIVDNDFINQLYRYNAKATYSNRSSHLEKERKIKLPDSVLEPFLMNDLHDVLASYFHDTQKRIQAAKYFGAADEGMYSLVEEMRGKGLNKAELDAAWEVFYSSVSDPKSNNIKQALEMTEKRRSLYSNFTALNTFNLMFAQTLNATQATANGLIYLSSRDGLKSPLTILKGLKRTLQKEVKDQQGNLIYGRDWAERIGAAAENTILEVAGEMGSLESRRATKFLKATGFTTVEKWQRQLAANIGRAYVEGLLESKASLLAKRTKRGPGKSIEKALSKVNERLLEFGIGPDIAPKNVSVGQMDRAGQRFSNITNFINTPDKLPLMWQSPHAKIFRQFKTFMFHQGAFLNDNLLKPLRKGDARPLAGLAAAGALGMGPSELRKWIKGDDEEYSMFEKYYQGFTAVGSFGLLYDLISQGVYGESRIVSSIAGPTVGLIAEQASGVARSVVSTASDGELNVKPSLQAMANFPIVAQTLDASGLVKRTGEVVDSDLLKEFPDRKEIKEGLSSKKKSSDPYNFYNNIYKSAY